MTFEQLEFILAVQREGTISAAAQSLNISHPAISRAISNLEGELGVNIFIRSRAGTAVTEKGELVLQCARKILTQADHLRGISGEDSKPQTILVKAFPVDSMRFLSSTIAQFRKSFENVTVSLSQTGITDILNDIKTQKVDFGIAALPVGEKTKLGQDVKCKVLFESALMVACATDSPLAQKPFLRPEDIENEAFVLHNDPIIIRVLKEIFASHGLPDVLLYSNDNSLIKQMVAEGKALSIYTQLLEERGPGRSAQEFVLKPLHCDDALNKVAYVCMYNSKKQLSASESAFLKAIVRQAACNKVPGPGAE